MPCQYCTNNGGCVSIWAASALLTGRGCPPPTPPTHRVWVEAYPLQFLFLKSQSLCLVCPYSRCRSDTSLNPADAIAGCDGYNEETPHTQICKITPQKNDLSWNIHKCAEAPNPANRQTIKNHQKSEAFHWQLRSVSHFSGGGVENPKWLDLAVPSWAPQAYFWKFLFSWSRSAQSWGSCWFIVLINHARARRSCGRSSPPHRQRHATRA